MNVELTIIRHPIINGNIFSLYSAFSAKLPIIVFIPNIAIPITAPIAPIILIMFNIFPPNFIAGLNPLTSSSFNLGS